MISIRSVMDFIASTVCFTALPLSSASRAPLLATCSIWRLFSEFCVIEALISSRLLVVSSTEAACSLVPCESDCEEEATCCDALEIAPVPPLTSMMIFSSFSQKALRDFDILPISSRELDSIRLVRSPSPDASSARYSPMAFTGRTIPRPITSATSKPAIRAVSATPNITASVRFAKSPIITA